MSSILFENEKNTAIFHSSVVKMCISSPNYPLESFVILSARLQTALRNKKKMKNLQFKMYSPKRDDITKSKSSMKDMMTMHWIFLSLPV